MNEDFLKCLNDMMIKADRNNQELRNDVKIRMEELSIKVDNAKKEAIEKEKRDEDKMREMGRRLEKIENKLKVNQDQCEKREKLAQEQRKRTSEFKAAVGLKQDKEEVEFLGERKSENMEQADRGMQS